MAPLSIPPVSAAVLADAILALHVAVVAFVVLGEILVLVGGRLGWRWVRQRSLRIGHLALIGFIALQAWFGALCPLTAWEQELRRHAGQAVYSESFIEHWLARLIFFEAPWPVFLAAYSGFALLVLLTWAWVPPQPRGDRASPGTH